MHDLAFPRVDDGGMRGQVDDDLHGCARAGVDGAAGRRSIRGGRGLRWLADDGLLVDGGKLGILIVVVVVIVIVVGISLGARLGRSWCDGSRRSWGSPERSTGTTRL